MSGGGKKKTKEQMAKKRGGEEGRKDGNGKPQTARKFEFAIWDEIRNTQFSSCCCKTEFVPFPSVGGKSVLYIDFI